MAVYFLVAVDEQDAISRQGIVPWHLKSDLKRFFALSVGQTVVMGRKTFEYIGHPLPKRLNIVLSRNRNFIADGAVVVHHANEALSQSSQRQGDVFVIGGQEVFEAFLPYAERIYLTRVHTSSGGDNFFKYDPKKWRILAQESHKAGPGDDFDFDFITLVKH
jgi:dihydrofolate reductase